MKAWLEALRALIWKDLLHEWRSREMLTAMLAFAVLVLFVFNYAMALNPKARAEIAPGIIWVVLIFAGSLGLNRSFTAEQDQGCFDGLLLAAPDLSLIYLAKAISNFLFMLALAVFIVPLYSLLYNQSLFLPGLFLVLALGAWGYSAVGTLIASMTVQTRLRDLLLPVLLFPLLLPLLMAVVKASSAFLAGLPLSEVQVWLNLVVVYDIIFSTAAYLVFEYVIKE